MTIMPHKRLDDGCDSLLGITLSTVGAFVIACVAIGLIFLAHGKWSLESFDSWHFANTLRKVTLLFAVFYISRIIVFRAWIASNHR